MDGRSPREPHAQKGPVDGGHAVQPRTRDKDGAEAPAGQIVVDYGPEGSTTPFTASSSGATLGVTPALG